MEISAHETWFDKPAIFASFDVEIRKVSLLMTYLLEIFSIFAHFVGDIKGSLLRPCGNF